MITEKIKQSYSNYRWKRAKTYISMYVSVVNKETAFNGYR